MKDRREFKVRKVRSDPCIPFRCDCCLNPIAGHREAVLVSKNPSPELVLVLCGDCLPLAAKALESVSREVQDGGAKTDP